MKSTLKVYALLSVLLVPCAAQSQQPLSSGSLKPTQVYYGGHNDTSNPVGLRIANGGAGQSGLIGAWADSFINYMVDRKGHAPFTVSFLVYLSNLD